jgi:hypothetical protein
MKQAPQYLVKNVELFTVIFLEIFCLEIIMQHVMYLHEQEFSSKFVIAFS